MDGGTSVTLPRPVETAQALMEHLGQADPDTLGGLRDEREVSSREVEACGVTVETW